MTEAEAIFLCRAAIFNTIAKWFTTPIIQRLFITDIDAYPVI